MSELHQRKGKGETSPKEGPEASSETKTAVEDNEKGQKKEDKAAKTAPAAKGAKGDDAKGDAGKDSKSGGKQPKAGGGAALAKSPPSAGRATYCLAMLLLVISLALCGAAVLEAHAASAASALVHAGITAAALKQTLGIELPGMLGAHLAHHDAHNGGAGAGAGGADDMVWFNEEGTDGMRKAEYEKYSGLWEDAVAYHQEERLQEAIETYSAALAVRPGDANCLANLGSIYNELDEHEKALEAYRQAIAAHPNHFVSHLNLAGTLDRQGAAKLGATEEALKAALKIRPDDANALDFMKAVQERIAEAAKSPEDRAADAAAAAAKAAPVEEEAKAAPAAAAAGTAAGAAAAQEEETIELLGDNESEDAEEEDEGGFGGVGGGGIPLPLD